MNTRLGLGILAYVVPTFVLGFVWHLILFADYYDTLAIYRDDLIIPLGLLSMLIQAVFFALLYEKGFAAPTVPATRIALYGLVAATLSWSFTTIAVAAKNIMSSVAVYMLIETAFTLVQWAIVAPLMALAFRQDARARAMMARAPRS